MKKAYAFAVLFMVQFVFSSCASRVANIETMKAFRDLCPEKKLSICSFELVGADRTKIMASNIFIGPLPSLAINAGRLNENFEYSQELAKEFHHIYEESLGKSGFFQLSSSANLLFLQDGKPLNLNDMAKQNNLYACVKAVSYMGVRMGFNKHVQVSTKWEITRSSGEKHEFITEAISEEAAGVFVDPTVPELKPVFLELARQNAQQFLTALGEGSETGSCLKDSLEKRKAMEEKRQEIEKEQVAALEAKNDGRFINKGNGTVTDTKTGLMWAARDNGRDIKWADAKSYCENYSGGGYTDWRMPTKEELAGLYDAGKARPLACEKSYKIHVATVLIDVTCFYLWSSEAQTRLLHASEAAYFYFIDGAWYWNSQSYASGGRALPVRSGK